MSALGPGLYRATVRGVPDTIVMVRNAGLIVTTFGGVADHWQITDARPLIILDPEALDWPEENRNKNRELARMIRLICDNDGKTYRSDMVRQIADLIDPPARIPEPGWDGKVAAHTVMDKVRRSFVCWQDGSEKVHRWADHEGMYDWDELIDPILIREGVS